MRSTVNHITPDSMQTMPHDNTSAYVLAQVGLWRTAGVLIHTQMAMEIAAWYTGPRNGDAFAMFASTGTIAPDFTAWISETTQERVADECPDVDALRALAAYIDACPFDVAYGMAYCPCCSIDTMMVGTSTREKPELCGPCEREGCEPEWRYTSEGARYAQDEACPHANL